MRTIKATRVKRMSVLVLTAAGCLLAVLFSRAQGVQHLSIAQPGGMPGLPIMTGITQNTNGVTITWDGPSGYYQVYQKLALTDPAWQTLGGPTNLSRTAHIIGFHSSAFFRVSGPSPNYAGARNCATCHGGIVATETNLPHAHALETLERIHQDSNPSCLVCHTVGYGLPTGFVSVTDAHSTNFLAGVQCENCHGPAANHAANPLDFTVLPRVELAAQVCGGCHSGEEHPTFEEWQTSGHAAVVPTVLRSMASSAGSISRCGRCHSGSARVAFLHGQDPSVTLTNDFDVAITCATCHDPHANHAFTNVLSGIVTNQFDGIVITNAELGAVYTNQLRNPLSSTNDYSLSTSDVFTNKYDPNINVCAQCHNARGATWEDTDRSPHHSVQYNMLIGTIGVLGTNTAPFQPSTHALMEKQCAYCHMQTAPETEGPSEPEGEMAAVTGHSFAVTSYQACTKCHGSNTNTIATFVSNTKSFILSNPDDTGIEDVKALLNLWAETKAPSEISGYGDLAWEYDNAGALSNPEGLSTIRGPHSDRDLALDEQKYIPDDIKKARFNLYLVLYDGSYGVHNGPYAFALLQNARDLVEEQLYQ